jgi:hypothetical protein
VTRREQELVDQMAAWRAQIDARPEEPFTAAPPEPSPPREDRLAESRSRRAERLGRPLDSPEASPADYAASQAPSAMVNITKVDMVITKADAEFAQWRRSRVDRRSGQRRAARSRR